jgi:glycosyltransferase involved in cell wall biosynthesis
VTLATAFVARRRPARALEAPEPLPVEMSVAAVVPALNEAGAITGVVAELQANGIATVVVVDGGSRDDTRCLARAAGARVVDEPRRGYGRACQSGADAVASDVIVFLDGDGSDDPAYVPALVDRIVSGDAALALGVRTIREPGAMLTHQLLGTRLVTMLLWLRYGVRVADIPPMRAIRRDVLDGLAMREMTFGWPTEMIVNAVRSGLPVAEVDVRARRRTTGRSKIAGRLGPSLIAGVRMVGVVLRPT